MKRFLRSSSLALWSSCGLATTTLLLLPLLFGGVSSFSIHTKTTTRAPRTATRQYRITSTTTLFSIDDAIRELEELEAFSNNKDNDVVERFSLQENFDRWRFLQNLLDCELDAVDVNEVLCRVLQGYIMSSSNNDSRQVEEGSSPCVTDDLRETIQGLLGDDNIVEALTDPECSPGEEHVLNTLETLLPDPQENEDAHKGAWDTVMELHGRESVKLNESSKTPQWKAVCLVARVLIYYDFLATGIME